MKKINYNKITRTQIIILPNTGLMICKRSIKKYFRYQIKLIKLSSHNLTNLNLTSNTVPLILINSNIVPKIVIYRLSTTISIGMALHLNKI